MSRAEVGCIHGRFQPFHNGHMEYALRAVEKCEHLFVGITNPDPRWIRREGESQHRHTDAANPYRYFERHEMIRRSLREAGIAEDRFTIVPFPIDDLAQLEHYVPRAALHYVRVFSAWEEEKARRLRGARWRVAVLDVGEPKRVSATEVRQLIAGGGDWRALVPEGTAQVLARILAAEPGR